MRKGVVLALAIAMTMPAILPARSDEIPTLDVQPVCRGIANQSGDQLEAGLRATFDQCIQSEQDVREQLKKAWSTFSAADKRHCVTLANTGGESSNTELLTCLEMARDVRAYRSAAAASGAATTRTPSSSSLSSPPPASPSASTVQPAPPTNASKTQVDDSTAKELQRAKVDALNARTSEAMAQRKLADAEADLKQAREEAGRASKEAEQAKMDAQKAQQSKAQAESKLAISEAARVAAEGREQACQSVAAKSQLGLRGWLRGLFGHKPSNPENP